MSDPVREFPDTPEAEAAEWDYAEEMHDIDHEGEARQYDDEDWDVEVGDDE